MALKRKPDSNANTLFNQVSLSLATMNPSPQDSSFSIYRRQQSKPPIQYGIMDAVLCWLDSDNLFYGYSNDFPSKFNDSAYWE